VLASCVADQRLPCAVVEAGSSAGVVASLAFGTSRDAIFDLASLTKVLATGLVTLRLIDEGRLNLDRRAADVLATWRGDDRATITVRDLLTHSSGLPAWLPLYDLHQGAEAMIAASAAAALIGPPRRAAVYSDLGFIVLGRLLEIAGDDTLPALTARTLGPLSADPPIFGVRDGDRARVVPTGVDGWRERDLHGEVHDRNAAAMGGVAGHAGLFGHAGALGEIAQVLLRACRGQATPLGPAGLVRAFTRRSAVPGSSRALAWDTARPQSSSGPSLTRRAFGHTGFTGTSMWIDPELDVYVVLLTNRVAASTSSDEMTRIRRRVHGAIGAAWGGSHDGG